MSWGTYGPHCGDEDNLTHLRSALYMQRLGSPGADIFRRVLQVNLLLQTQGRYRVSRYPEKNKIVFYVKD